MRTAIRSLAVVTAITALAAAGLAQAQMPMPTGPTAGPMSGTQEKAENPDAKVSDYDSPEAIRERALRERSQYGDGQGPTRGPVTPSGDKGKQMAPAIIAQQRLPCTMTDAKHLFVGNVDNPGGQIKADFIEVACENALGYVLAKHQGRDTATVFDCIQTSAKGADGNDQQTRCTLPGNASPELTLVPHLGARAATCTPTAAASLGLATNGLLYEVRCAQGDGLLVVKPKPGQAASGVTVSTCFSRIGTPVACTLTKPAESTAAVLALAAQSGKACSPTDQRYMAGRANGGAYYEFACADKSGLVVVAKPDGSFEMAATCAQAVNIAGGCKLTTARP